MVFFYLPSAFVVIHLNSVMPLEGGLYQWAKLGFNELVGFLVAWNLWLFAILNTSETGLQATQYLGYIVRSEEHTSELQSHSDLSSFPTRRSSDLDGVLLPAIRLRRHSSQQRHAARRRSVSMGQARVQRARRVSRRVELVALCDSEHVRNRSAGDAISRLHRQIGRAHV